MGLKISHDNRQFADFNKVGHLDFMKRGQQKINLRAQQLYNGCFMCAHTYILAQRYCTTMWCRIQLVCTACVATYYMYVSGHRINSLHLSFYYSKHIHITWYLIVTKRLTQGWQSRHLQSRPDKLTPWVCRGGVCQGATLSGASLSGARL